MPCSLCESSCLLVGRLVGMVAGLIVMWHAYDIRLFAIREYGAIIHEFDPYFNYRAAEYLADNGWTDFFRWFDHMSWYPLGRPVGTTIYPGPQLAAVGIWRAGPWSRCAATYLLGSAYSRAPLWVCLQ